MKKLLALLFTFTMLIFIGTSANAQTYKTGKVYVEGSSTAYGNGATITIAHGKTIHIARIADGKAPLSENDFWYSCWIPTTLTKYGFKLYGADGGDGASFKNYSGAYGPYINTSKVKPGTYSLKFYFASAADVNKNFFTGAKQYDPCTIKIKVIKGSQNLTVKTTAKNVSRATVKKKAVTLSSVITVSGAKTSLTYKKKSGSGYLSISSATGKITVRKNTPKGKYTAKILVTAKSNTYYNAAQKTVTVTIVVK